MKSLERVAHQLFLAQCADGYPEVRWQGHSWKHPNLQPPHYSRFLSDRAARNLLRIRYPKCGRLHLRHKIGISVLRRLSSGHRNDSLHILEYGHRQNTVCRTAAPPFAAESGQPGVLRLVAEILDMYPAGSLPA